MDQELKQFLIEMEERLVRRMDERDARLVRRMDERFDQVEVNAAERTEKSETNLLTARPAEIKNRGMAVLVAGCDERLTLLEERVSELERRKAS